MDVRRTFFGPGARGRASVVALSVVALAGAAGVATAAPASAADFVSEGTIYLTTGATDAITLGDQTQTITSAAGCIPWATTGASLLAMSGSTPGGAAGVNFGGDGIGVSGGGNACAVNATKTPSTAKESLTIAVVSAPGLTRVASAATLDLEFKEDAKVVATTVPADGSAGESFTLVRGKDDRIGIKTVRPASDDIRGCIVSAGSTLKGAAGDNCLWGISPAKPFTAITLTAAKGTFDLEGGADWGAVDGRTSFDVGYVAEGLATCGTPITEAGTGTKPAVEINRQPDANATGCTTTIPYTLSNGDNSFQFLKPGVDLNSQFIVNVVWKKTIPVSGFATTTVNWETPAAPASLVLGTCPAALYVGDVLTPLTDPAPLVPLDMVPNTDTGAPGAMDGVQYACIDTTSSKVIDGGATLQTTEVIYLIGDVAMRG